MPPTTGRALAARSGTLDNSLPNGLTRGDYDALRAFVNTSIIQRPGGAAQPFSRVWILKKADFIVALRKAVGAPCCQRL